MQHNQLLNLLASNAKRGEFRIEAEAEGATIFLYDMIAGSELEAEIFGGVEPKGFLAALKANDGKPVTIRVNSPGGHVFAAQAMAQAVREHNAPVTVIVDGLVASAATFIASAASKVVMGPGALMMIHKAHTLTAGNADDLMARAGLLEKVDGIIASSYATKSGKQDAAQFADLMAAETWFDASGAVDIGLADEVAADGGNVHNAIDWNLSAYDNAPKQQSTTIGELKVKLTLDADEFKAELAAISDTAAAIVKDIKEHTETEQKRPNLKADMLLRPAA
jgi:ATP-dependent Clp protease protease subunit